MKSCITAAEVPSLTRGKSVDLPEEEPPALSFLSIRPIHIACHHVCLFAMLECHRENVFLPSFVYLDEVNEYFPSLCHASHVSFRGGLVEARSEDLDEDHSGDFSWKIQKLRHGLLEHYQSDLASLPEIGAANTHWCS